MKKEGSVFLIIAIVLSSTAIFSPSTEAQTPPPRTVWQNPFTLTTFHSGNEVNSTFYTFPKVIWDGSQYVDYVFNSSDMSAGIGSVYLKVFPDHTVFYDPYRTEERIERETWTAECYNASSSVWLADSPVDEDFRSKVDSSGIYLDRKTTLNSGSTIEESYWLRIGSSLKISVVFHPAESRQYRLVWSLNEIPAVKAQWLTVTEDIDTQSVNDTRCSRVRFTDENESKCLVDWSDAGFLNKTTEKWQTYFQKLELQRNFNNRSQARITFGNFALTNGQSLTLDPTVNTFNSNGALDGLVEKYGPSYPPSSGTFVDTDVTYLIVGQAHNQMNGGYMIDRSYLSFDTSSVPAMAYNISATLRLMTDWLDTYVNFTVQVWGGNQPVYDENVTILDGVQPIYGDNLTADDWGKGRVNVATWNTADYPGDGVYINFTIPSNQINKVNCTQFELNSSRDGATAPWLNCVEDVGFYSGNATGCEPKLEVSYNLDTLTVGGVPWFYRGVSNSKVVMVFFGGSPSFLYNYILIFGIDYIPYEKRAEKIRFLDALVENGFSVLTPANNYTLYDAHSMWVEDALMWLMYDQNYVHVFLFGFSGGGVVVGQEIQKEYATRFSAAVMTCAPVNASVSGSIFNSANTAALAKVATSFPEPYNDPYKYDMLLYYHNALIHKEWHEWDDGHAFFDYTCLDCGRNDSSVVIDWFNAAHPPSTPFTPSGPNEGYTNTSYGYTSGTIDPNGDNVTYQFDWGDGTSDMTGYVSSGVNVTVYHSWNSTGLHNVTVRAEDATNPSAWSPPNTVSLFGAGDIDHDGTVTILDAILLANAFNSKPGDQNWNSAADLNNDGTVNILDAIILSNHYGEKYETGIGMSGQQLSGGAMIGGEANVLVEPSQIAVFKGEVFTVNVNVTGVTDLQGWEFKLYWNSTVLNCTNAAVVTPTIWQGNTQDYGPGLEANYNATHGRFYKAETAAYPSSSFNGSMTIATLTFQAVQPGTTSLTLTDAILGNSTAQPMTCGVSSGSVNVYYGRYMRSDTQTINGLNAYKLNVPESISSSSDTEYGDTAGAWWGIRAWVRHSNGTEQEISLGGQTGTPAAVVYRYSGMGIQSATATVAQTALQPTDSLVVRVYTKVGTDSTWTLSATFTTEQLQATTLQATTWTIYYYTYARWNRYIQTETAILYWGTTTYNSRIQNLQYS